MIERLTDAELADAFVRTYGVSKKRALELVEIHRGRAKRDLRQRDSARIDDFARDAGPMSNERKR